jgi:5'-methylthioadenosine phosphorylase
MSSARVDLEDIGGSGFYEVFDRSEVPVDTPYGPFGPDPDRRSRQPQARPPQPTRPGPPVPSAWHQLSGEHLVLADLGLQKIYAPCAVGSLRTELPPGTVVVPDRLIDRTNGRRCATQPATSRSRTATRWW